MLIANCYTSYLYLYIYVFLLHPQLSAVCVDVRPYRTLSCAWQTAVEERSVAMSLSVCLSLCTHISETTRLELHKFSARVVDGNGPILL